MTATDPDVLRQALADLQPRLYRFALGLSGSTHDAHDLVQAGYERALGRLDQWQPGTRLDSWMYRIIQSLYFNRLKAEKVRRRHVASADPERGVGADSAASAIGQMTLERVRDCVGRLPHEQRACLVLVAVEGLSYRDTAEVLGVPIGTVTSRLARARAALKAMLAGSGERPRSEGDHEQR